MNIKKTKVVRIDLSKGKKTIVGLNTIADRK